MPGPGYEHDSAHNLGSKYSRAQAAFVKTCLRGGADTRPQIWSFAVSASWDPVNILYRKEIPWLMFMIFPTETGERDRKLARRLRCWIQKRWRRICLDRANWWVEHGTALLQRSLFLFFLSFFFFWWFCFYAEWTASIYDTAINPTRVQNLFLASARRKQSRIQILIAVRDTSATQ